MFKAIKATALTLVTTAFIIPTAMTAPVHAGPFGSSDVKQWNVCEWERIPDSVLTRITKRSDFDDILRRMFDSCPDSALGLTDRPTASVSTSNESGGFGNRQGGSDGAPSESTRNSPSGPSAGSNDNDTSFGLPG